MNCQRLRRLLADEGEGNGSLVEAAAIETHLRNCSTCRRLQHDLGNTEAELRELAQGLPSGRVDLVDLAIERVLEERKARRSRCPLSLTPSAWRLSLGCVGIALLLASVSRQVNHKPRGHSPQQSALIAESGFPGSRDLAVPTAPLLSARAGQGRSVVSPRKPNGDSGPTPRPAGGTPRDQARGNQSPYHRVPTVGSRRDRSVLARGDHDTHTPAPPSRSVRQEGRQPALPQLVDASGGQIAAALDRYERERMQHSRSVLQDVPALRRPVTFSELKIPLGELVRRVAKATGVPLTAGPAVADEPVAVVVNNYPARDLLIQIADLLDYQWSRHSKGAGAARAGEGSHYEIWQDLASRRREEELRQVLFVEAEEQFQEKIGRLLDVAKLPPDRIREILDEPQNPALANLPTDSPEGKALIQRVEVANQVASPIPRGLAFLLGRLTPEEWALLQADRPVVFSTDPGPGEVPLPADVVQLFHDSQPTWLHPGQRDFLGQTPEEERLRESLQQRERETQNRWASATGYRALIRVEGNRLRPGSILTLTARAEPLQGGSPDPVPQAVGTDLTLGAAVGGSLLQREPSTPERQAALARDPVAGMTKRFQPEEKRTTETAAEETGGWTMRRDWTWRRWDQLPDLARSYHVNFIADAYESNYAGLMPMSLPASGAPVPLYRLLDTLASITHRWDHEGNLIRLRSRTWFLDRPREIPLRLVRRWNALCEQHGALALDEYLRMVTTLLSDIQIDGLPQLASQGEVAASMPELSAIANARDTLRLYAGLTPAQRQALWRGLPVSLAPMTAAQRDLLQAALERIKPKDLLLSEKDLATAQLSLTARPRVLVVEQRPGVVTYQVGSLPSGGRAAASEAVPVAGSASSRDTGGQKPSGVKRFPVVQIIFRYQFGSHQFDLSPLTVSGAEGR